MIIWIRRETKVVNEKVALLGDEKLSFLKTNSCPYKLPLFDVVDYKSPEFLNDLSSKLETAEKWPDSELLNEMLLKLTELENQVDNL